MNRGRGAAPALSAGMAFDEMGSDSAALFADLNIGQDAAYIFDGGTPVLVRLVATLATAAASSGR